jgi:hypothetical protein
MEFDPNDLPVIVPSPAPVEAVEGQILDIENAVPVRPKELPHIPLEPMARAGVELTKWVLVFMALFVLLDFGFLFFFEVRLSALFAENYKQVLQNQTNSVDIKSFLLEVENQRKEFREFWSKTTQTVLLNLLLPVLTALLGYVFGSKEGRQNKSD